MFHLSNTLIGILNFLTFLLSIPILWLGIWLSKQGGTECDKWLDKPLIVLGVFLLLVSLTGFVGACFRNSLLLWIYLVVMFLLILIVLAITIFAFVITTNKGAGEVLPGKAYKEYRLRDYSHWLQNRVNDSDSWNRIKFCLQSGGLCTDFQTQYAHDDVHKFYTEKLLPLQSGCCKPSNDCNFEYQSPTVWDKTASANHTNPDCNTWKNDPNILCFNCNSCKAGLLQNMKTNWKKTAVIDIIFLIFLIIVYSIGCCAFRNIKRDNWK